MMHHRSLLLRLSRLGSLLSSPRKRGPIRRLRKAALSAERKSPEAWVPAFAGKTRFGRAKRLPTALLLFALLALSGCGDSATTVEFAKLCVKELDGKTIATTGYLHAPFATLCRSTTRRGGTTTTCSFDLRDKPDGEVRVSLNIEVGRGENRVDEARLKAKQGAAAIAASDAKFLADKAQVRVTGALHAVPNSLKPEETICWLDVETIERR